ncbi:ParB/RepB/Spo0J family partition protein [Feifania hominis]|uniref:ParB/RepB/Spo0J family partition protein n=1 Tax=Feifania hominis TaxID=2763660 RepID=A0A926DFQ5_9FIRM|nr:ParB/RepB/Spo0J family partition protein [Feifania hominis]MBC8536459.1 ParB/RepB/Spo0J family partition protein [Feifania hominis]
MKKGLGKGLDSLFADNTMDISVETGVKTLRLSEIEPNKNQPRKDFDEDALGELADSIAENGVLSPLIVRPLENGRYQIIAGERRWRASRLAGLAEVPVVIMEADDRRTMELALIENLQREDLGPLEESEGYQRLAADFGLTQEQIAKRVGKSRPAVANALRLLALPREVLSLLREGALTAGHARALLALPDDDARRAAAERIVKGELSVREAEQLVKRLLKPAPAAEPAPRENYALALQSKLEQSLGRKVRLAPRGKAGKLELYYTDNDDLAELLARLGVDND